MSTSITFDIKKLRSGFGIFSKKLAGYASFIFILSVLLLYTFLVFKIGQHAQVEPTEEEVSSKLSGFKRLQIDQESLKKIEQLEDQNIAIQSLFESARDNPFQDQ